MRAGAARRDDGDPAELECGPGSDADSEPRAAANLKRSAACHRRRSQAAMRPGPVGPGAGDPGRSRHYLVTIMTRIMPVIMIAAARSVIGYDDCDPAGRLGLGECGSSAVAAAAH
jgi:hypothetical protein